MALISNPAILCPDPNLQITKSLLSTVVARNRLVSTESFPSYDPWVTPESWGMVSEINEPENSISDAKIPLKLKHLIKLVKTLENAGQPQASICTQIIKHALEIDKPDLGTLEWIFNQFDDIPEVYLVKLLDILFELFAEAQISDSISSQITVEVLNSQITEILKRRFQVMPMVRHLKSLSFPTIKKLLIWLMENLDKHWEIDSGIEIVPQFLKWIMAILDSHYPSFVMADETGVVENLLSFLDRKLLLMDEIEKMEPLLLSTLHNVSFKPKMLRGLNYRREVVYFE